jgi:hypothetical protein
MTAAVVGGAAHMGAKSAQKGAAQQQQAAAAAEQDAAQSAQIAELQAQQAADPLAEVQKLAGLHAAGILTDEEFAAAKAKALGI